jgi:DNA-directed RNA polymerase specialized sigma24 family protein
MLTEEFSQYIDSSVAGTLDRAKELNVRSSQATEQREALRQSISLMLQDSEGERYSPILKTLDRYLRQFHLRGTYEPMDLFNEICVRAWKIISAGGEIPNLPAWCRTTGLHIVQEWSRKEVRQQAISERIFQFERASYAVNSDIEAIDLIEVLDGLEPMERQLLVLTAEGFTTNEIARKLFDLGLTPKVMLPSVLTKQRHRLRHRLASM